MRNQYKILAEKYTTHILSEKANRRDWPDQPGLIFTGKISPDGQSALYTTGPKQALNSYWYNKKGELHNNFGPAFYTDTHKVWWVNGKRHRLDGPADISIGRKRGSNYEDYFIDGKRYSKEDFDKKVKEIKTLQQTQSQYGVDLNDLEEQTDQGNWPMLQDWEFEGKISADGESALYKSKPGTRRSIAYVWFNKQVKLHNNLGPAFLNSRSKVWYINGKKHRLDGPAEIVDSVPGRGNGWEDYYIDNTLYSKEAFDKKIKELKTLQQTVEPYDVDLNDLEEQNTQGEWPTQPHATFTGKVSPDGESGLYKSDDRYTATYYWLDRKGQLHNNSGPAYFTENQKAWYVNGKRHRLDGPAYILKGRGRRQGIEKYYIDDKEYSKEDYEKKIKEIKALQQTQDQYGVDLNDLMEGTNDWPKTIKKGIHTVYHFTGEVTPDGESGRYKYKPSEKEQYWFNKQQLLHNKLGPAYVYSKHTKQWYINGKLHRLDGPAVMHPSYNVYYIDGEKYSEEDFNKKVKEIKDLQQAGEPYGVDLTDLGEATNDDWPPDFYGIKYTGEVSSDGESREIKDYLGTYWINKQGDYHNNEQPAIQYNNGDFYWIVNGVYHNLNGPSVVEKNPSVRAYYISGKEYSKEDFDKKVQQIKDLQQAGAPYGVDLNDL